MLYYTILYYTIPYPGLANDRSEPYSPGESRLYDNDPRSKRLSSGSTKGLMDGAAAPGQSLPEDKQQKKIKEIRAEVDEARIAIEDTVQKLQERGELMDDLQGKTDKLSFASKTFKTSATKTRRRMWLQNAKWTICLTIFILIILAGVIAGAVKGSQVAKEKVVEQVSSLTASATAMPATATSSPSNSNSASASASGSSSASVSASNGVGIGIASVVSTGKESGNLGNSVTAYPAQTP